jgi:guanylate kinase
MNHLRAEPLALHFCVTATTRPRRPTEVEGVNHYFVTEEQFEAMIAANELLEWARVHERYYGVPLLEVRRAFAERRDVFMRIDVQGAATVRARLPQSVLIFLAPERLEDLAPRLQERNTETPAEMALRLANARREMEALPHFDYVVVNRQGHLEESVARVRAIILAERARVAPRWVTL